MPLSTWAGLDAEFCEVGRVETTCPACGKEGGLAVMKGRGFLRLLVVKVGERNLQYLAVCGHCAGIFTLPQEKGMLLEKTGHCCITANELLPFDLAGQMKDNL